jgi:hypothetical protein
LEVTDPEDPNCSDFVLRGRSCWVDVGNIAIYIHKTDEGVVVQLYAGGYEMQNELSSTSALFQDAENAIEEFELEN